MCVRCVVYTTRHPPQPKPTTQHKRTHSYPLPLPPNQPTNQHHNISFLGLARQDKAHYYVSLVPAFIFSAVSILIGATIAK